MSKRSSRDTILEALRQGKTVSGQELADAAGLSRTAVWKHIRFLRREGYTIESQAGSGYRLCSIPDGLPAREIAAGLDESLFGHRIVSLEETDSTQREASELARQGCPEGAVVVAEGQTAGRGRVRRRWFSAPGGLALSVVLRPEIQPSQAALFTLLAGVSCASSIIRMTGLEPALKWPNDVMLGHRKVAGILAEMSGQPDRIDFLILGLGININTPFEAWPEELKETATSLRQATGTMISPVRMIQDLLGQLECDYADFNRGGLDRLLDRWRAVSSTLGRQVTVHRPDEDIPGLARDIDHQGALIVETESGLLTVHAGDVSLREGS